MTLNEFTKRITHKVSDPLFKELAYVGLQKMWVFLWESSIRGWKVFNLNVGVASLKNFPTLKYAKKLVMVAQNFLPIRNILFSKMLVEILGMNAVSSNKSLQNPLRTGYLPNYLSVIEIDFLQYRRIGTKQESSTFIPSQSKWRRFKI